METLHTLADLTTALAGRDWRLARVRQLGQYRHRAACDMQAALIEGVLHDLSARAE